MTGPCLLAAAQPAQLADRTLAVVSCARLDLTVRSLKQPPIYIGSYRDKVLVYDSIIRGDELEGELANAGPKDYGRLPSW